MVRGLMASPAGQSLGLRGNRFETPVSFDNQQSARMRPGLPIVQSSDRVKGQGAVSEGVLSPLRELQGPVNSPSIRVIRSPMA